MSRFLTILVVTISLVVPGWCFVPAPMACEAGMTTGQAVQAPLHQQSMPRMSCCQSGDDLVAAQPDSPAHASRPLVLLRVLTSATDRPATLDVLENSRRVPATLLDSLATVSLRI